MSWIPIRHDLPEDPAVIGIAVRLGLDEDFVVGKLFRVWSWFDRQTVDGVAKCVTGEWLDRFARLDGLAAAMVEVGWLVVGDGLLTMPRFDTWISESAKVRLMNSRRKQREREKKGSVAPVSRNERDKIVTRGQDRTGQEKSCSGTGGRDRATNGFEGRCGSKGPTKGSAFEFVTRDTLTDAKRLLEWFHYQGKRQRPLLSQHPDSWDLCCAAAVQALSHANPPAEFARLLGKKDCRKEITTASRIAGKQFARQAA